MSSSMPIRTRAHELAEEAVLVFRKRFAGWAIRVTTENDYGVDAEVEVFSQSGRATGLTFKVQIKGTDKSFERGRLGVRINRSTLNYWRSLDVPVLVFAYSSPRREAFARWAHSFDQIGEITRTVRTDSKTLTFPFRATHIMRATSLPRLHDELLALRALKERVSLGAIPVGLDIKVRSTSEHTVAEIESELVSALSESNIFRVSDNDSVTATIRITKDAVRFAMPTDLTSITIRYPLSAPVTHQEPASVIADVMLLAAWTLSNLGLHQSAKTLVDIFLERSNVSHLAELAETIVLSYLDQKDSAGAFRILGPILVSPEAQHRDLAEMSMAIVVLGDTSDLTCEARNLVIQVLRDSAEIEAQIRQAALGANRIYLAANLARSHRDFRTAIELMSSLPGWEPSYEDRGYFHRELGGALADSERWHEASESYVRALSTSDGQPYDIQLVLADALLYSGEYAKSLELTTRPDTHPVFKRRMLILTEVVKFAVDVVGLDRQDRSQFVANPFADRSDQYVPTTEEVLSKLAMSDALDLNLIDLLITDAFNQADVDRYTLGLLVTRCWLELEHPASWIMAIAIAVELSDDELAAALAECMVKFCRSKVGQVLGSLKGSVSAGEFNKIRDVVNSASRHASFTAPNVLRFFQENEAPIIISIDEMGRPLQVLSPSE